MSASAAAIPSPAAHTNPSSLSLDSNSRQDVKRRTVAVVKKPNAEVLSEAGVNGVADKRVIAGGKDLSHTIRGESVVERPKALSQAKRDLAASAVALKQKKSAHRSERPKWQIVFNVIMKASLLLAVLLWMGQLVWRWKNGSLLPLSAVDTEGRISEVEASLKRTAKMLQVQLEVIDKKIGNEISKVKTDLTKQVADKGAFLEVKLKKLEGRADTLDKSLAELGEMGFFTKMEFEQFIDELKKSRGLGGSDHVVTLDDARHFAKEIVEKEIEKHAADGLGRVDYALASGGAKVVRHSEPYTSGKASNWLVAGKGRSAVHSNAHKMLEPSFGEPGQCFALQGSAGFVEIKLRTGIVPEAVTLEHVSKSVAYDRSSAPKDCRVSGWYEGPDDDPSARSEKMLLLTEFAYDLEKSNAQTFNVEGADPARVINMVRLDFTSNHGSHPLTCIYRFRVHGYEPTSLGADPMIKA
ncbi:Protein SAD1/UNC-84 domain protein 1 [Ananas comosus]|uniref:Protein SAD1/UNC-84 domain protein 1 n=1 Tax=Ananas comosus TaxID=4615 RepID=A0A199UL11_ANACO|nr:Protein SAD1/UNC-84 domain protein 1 [Ananas comosus]